MQIGNDLITELKSLKFLNKKFAQIRREMIKGNVKYCLYLNLLKDVDSYFGVVKINFLLNSQFDKSYIPIFIDFQGNSVLKTLLNKNETILDWKNKFIYIEQQNPFLHHDQENELVIHFSSNYSKDGTGLFKYIDSMYVYIYSCFWPDKQQICFPGFDQPNIKGNFKLFLSSHQNFQVISNENIENELIFQQENAYKILDWCMLDANYFQQQFSKEITLYEFRTTPILSTYLYAILAGDYRKITYQECMQEQPKIQLNLYCRNVLFQFLSQQAKQIFQLTASSIKFYENFFGIPFPFSKYDQIFCPEFNFGAMENVGAVTFTDFYIFRDSVAMELVTKRADSISHELSHQWFGNLVTFEWWDDLWLNESFANFISHFCLKELQNSQQLDFELCSIPRIYFLQKDSGYQEDSFEYSTHAIATDVYNTEQASSILDGITHQKGSAVIYQLLCYIGKEKFQIALKQYFIDNSFKNCSRNDLLQAIQNQINNIEKFNFNQWQKEWLLEPGHNIIRVSDNSWTITKLQNNQFNIDFEIKQSALLQKYSTLRMHKIKIALFNINGKIIKILDVIVNNQQCTKIEFVIDINESYQKESDFLQGILLNYQDQSFIKVRFDLKSKEFFQNNLSNIENSLNRSMIWRIFYEEVEWGELPLQYFLKLFENQILNEKEKDVIIDALECQQAMMDWIPYSERVQIFDQLFKIIFALKNQVQFSKKQFLDKYLAFYAISPQNITQLLQHYDQLSSYDMWQLTKQLAASSHFSQTEKEQYIEKISSKDYVPINIQQCRVLMETDALKLQNYWQIFINSNEYTKNVLVGMMKGFNNNFMLKELKEVYAKKYFNDLEYVFKIKQMEIAKEFAIQLFPKLDDLNFLDSNLQQLIQKIDKNNFTLQKFLNKMKQNNEKKKTIYKQYFQNK